MGDTMTGRPQREKPKQTCRLAIGKDVYASILPLYRTKEHEFSSLSQLVETIIFLSEHIYIAEPDNSYVIGLAKLQSKRIIEQIENPELLAFRYIHVTLDEQAIAFVDLLVEKYPMLVKTRSEAVELLLLSIGADSITPKEIRYYANRLADVLSMHPTRAGSAQKN